jgi:hypothetical protein
MKSDIYSKAAATLAHGTTTGISIAVIPRTSGAAFRCAAGSGLRISGRRDARIALHGQIVGVIAAFSHLARPLD